MLNLTEERLVRSSPGRGVTLLKCIWTRLLQKRMLSKNIINQQNNRTNIKEHKNRRVREDQQSNIGCLACGGQSTDDSTQVSARGPGGPGRIRIRVSQGWLFEDLDLLETICQSGWTCCGAGAL